MVRLFTATSVIFAAIASLARADIPAGSDGFYLVWSDDFTGAANSPPTASNWQYDLGTGYSGGTGNWGTGEVETATNNIANCYQDGNGNLRIIPLKDGSGAWTSARIESIRDDFQPPSGGVLAVESKIQLPNVSGDAAAGYWPAFWMLGTPFRGNYNNWPSIGEFDIMESINGFNTVYGTLHGGTYGGDCDLGGKMNGAHPSLQEDFHVYRFEWDDGAQELRWYLDGQQYWTVSASQVSAETWQGVTSHPFFIILNVAMGGGFPAAFGGGPTSATESGVPMIVDYVAVYQKSV